MAIAKWLGSGSINIFGRPFAGKDTQSERLAAWLHAPVIGGGEILRSRQDAAHLKDIHGGGHLVPQQEYLRIITPYLEQKKFAGRPLILSSVGRWHGEEPTILKATERAGHPLRAVLYIDISPAQAIERLEERQATHDRDDDKHHVLDVRMQEFATKTQPVLDFYKLRGLLITVPGRHLPDDVEADVINVLYAYAANS